MTRENINRQAIAIVTSLAGVSRIDAVKILSVSIQLIASEDRPTDKLDNPCFVANGNLIRKKSGSPSRFEKDPELIKFISNLDHYYTCGEMLTLLVKQFGKERAPSKSSLGRYLQKISGANRQANRGTL